MNNRHDRRTKASQDRKLSRDATDDEIFPGGHGPIQPEAAETMTKVARALKTIFGDNYEITLFVAEKTPTAGRTEPRFNYISTAARKDMLAVLRAFLAKNEAIAPQLDKIENMPPTERRQ